MLHQPRNCKVERYQEERKIRSRQQHSEKRNNQI